MQPVQASDLFRNHDKESSDRDSIVGKHAPSAQGTRSLKTKVPSRGITKRRMAGAPLAEKSVEQQAEVLPDDLLEQVAEIEADCASKAVKTVAPKKRRKRTEAAVWTNGALCLQAVELSRPAPISEKAKQFRQENLYGGRIRRMSVGAFLGLQKKKAVRRNMKAIVKHN
uniref:Iga fc receptor n=1 Tax=Rhipicephalus zambeziensis TaxID=60191 RepID=A0A224Z1X5_9ACAR